MRAKTVIQKLFSLGICISYQRCLRILNNIACTLLDKFDLEKVFVGNSRLNQFTIIVKDNIDVNAKSTKVEFHYHGISFTLMPFLTELFIGESQEPLYDLSKQPTRKLQLPESYSNFKELTFKTNAPLFSPVPTYEDRHGISVRRMSNYQILKCGVGEKQRLGNSNQNGRTSRIQSMPKLLRRHVAV